MMKNNLKILLVACARPNFMKIAPIIPAIKKFNNLINSINPTKPTKPIKYILVHTGQHYDVKMSETFFRELGLPIPDVNLEVGSASHAVQTANIMIRFEEVCLKEKPDWVLVVGDTLVQIRFLKTSFLGQHNEDGTMINPIMPLNTLFLGLLRPYRQSFDPVYFGQQNECIK